ncbi:MAG: thiol-disulfide oxidoreductase DCC family protein [Akkermansiaceae bacterium]
MDFRHGHIMFLDDECLLCRNSSHLIHHLDHNKCIYFSPLQGKTAEMLPPEWRKLSDTSGVPGSNVILAEYTNDEHYAYWHGADAILRLLLLTKSILSPLWIFYYTPSALKDAAYNQIAQNRYRLSSKIKNCPTPSPSLKDMMLP